MTSALWYAARGTGVVSLLLFTAVMLLGIVSRSGRTVGGTPRFTLALLHRNVSLLAVMFLIGHLVTLFLDPYAKLKLVDFLVPFLGTYKPLWQGLGTVAFDLTLALVATSLLRVRLGHRVWRAVHWFAYASWPIALVHGLGNGSDTSTWWLRLLAATCFLAVAGAVIWRAQPGFFAWSGRRRSAPPVVVPPPAQLGQWPKPASRTSTSVGGRTR
jgi:sulfoxide reductase heme-binding subunit YedZ